MISVRSIKLEQGKVDFWRLSFVGAENNRNTAFAILSSEEQARALNMKHHAAQLAFLYTRAALRTILSYYLNQAPADFVFHYNEFGKPLLVNNEQKLNFSVSHTHEMAVIAIGCEIEIGVDIEIAERNVDRLAIARRFFAPSEAACLMLPENADKFFLFWTLKEAILKASGLGISELLHEVVFDLDEGAKLVSVAEVLGNAADWQVGLLDYLPNTHVGAYAIKGHINSLNYLDY